MRQDRTDIKYSENYGRPPKIIPLGRTYNRLLMYVIHNTVHNIIIRHPLLFLVINVPLGELNNESPGLGRDKSGSKPDARAHCFSRCFWHENGCEVKVTAPIVKSLKRDIMSTICIPPG